MYILFNLSQNECVSAKNIWSAYRVNMKVYFCTISQKKKKDKSHLKRVLV